MSKSRLLIAISGAVLALFVSTLVAPAQALNVTMPAEWAEMPMCGDADPTEMCVQTFEVDGEANGNWENVIDDQELKVHAYLFDFKDNDVASMEAYVTYTGYGDLAPRVPLGGKIAIEINTRDWKPNPQAFSRANIQGFSVTEVDGEWITSTTIETKGISLKRSDEDGGGIVDTISAANIILWGDEYRDAYSVVFDGMWTSSNAASTTSPVYDETNMTWTIKTSGPALNSQGDPNVAYFNAFFPDSAIIAAYGGDPEAMLGVFKVLREDGSQTVEQEVTISRVAEPTPGILIEIPAYSFSSNDVVEATLSGIAKKFAPYSSKKFRNPTHVIKPKKKLISAPVLQSAKVSGKQIALTGSKVSAADSYQGVCIKGSKLKYATANYSKVTVKNLSKGNWSCRIRGVKKIGGKWSNSINLKVN